MEGEGSYDRPSYKEGGTRQEGRRMVRMVQLRQRKEDGRDREGRKKLDKGKTPHQIAFERGGKEEDPEGKGKKGLQQERRGRSI